MAKALYERIVEHYTGLIRVGELRPGDWLPTQAQIAHAWQCSLTPVKHAMYELEHAGLIENYQGKGARVTQQEAPRP